MNSDGANILVVEDEPELRELLQTDLEELGYKVVPAKNGYEALEILRFRSIDVILSDLNMPELGGMQLIRAARSSGFNMPFIVLSAYGTRAEAIELMRLGVFDFLEKPAKFEDLKNTVAAAAKLSRQMTVVKEELLKTMGVDGKSLTPSSENAINALTILKAMRATV